MNNVKVAYKILLLVVIAFLGMAIIGFRGWSSLSKAGEGMDNMYSKKLQAIRILGDEIDAMRVIQVRTYQAIADPPRATEVVAGAKKQIAKYEKEWAEYETLANAVPEMQGPVKDAKANWDRYRKSMETVMDIASKGQSQEALAEYNRTARKETADLRDKLNNLLKASEENAAKINAENETENRNAIMSMVVITVIAVVILGLLSLMLIKALTSPLTERIADCVKLKDGDFRMDNRDTSRGDEFGDAQRALFAMRESLNKFMRRIAESSEQIAASSEELTANSSQTAKVAMQVAESVSDAANVVSDQQTAVDGGNEKVSMISASVDEMRSQAELVARNSASAADEAANGRSEIDSSVNQIKNVETTVTDTAAIVDKLGERSKEIGTIVDTISGIAGQTNLLALNAAIEAARAGEHGRGFAVVAEEVRKLAEQSQTAAQQIADLIGTIQSDTTSAVASMQEGRSAVIEGAQSVEGLRAVFDSIKNNIDEVSNKVATMSEAVAGVATQAEGIAMEMNAIDDGAKKVSDQMQTVSASTEEQSASAEEIASASDALAQLAQDLQLALQRFKF